MSPVFATLAMNSALLIANFLEMARGACAAHVPAHDWRSTIEEELISRDSQ
jgi:hypothetical protein